MVPNQGLQAIAFFEATACLTLLALFIHLKRDNAAAFYKLWLLGWVCLALSSFSELALFFSINPASAWPSQEPTWPRWFYSWRRS